MMDRSSIILDPGSRRGQGVGGQARGVKARAVAPGAGSRARPAGLEEPAVAMEQLAVGVDGAARASRPGAAGAEVGHEVPVQPGLVRAAGLREPGAEREVERAADLLVEERV